MRRLLAVLVLSAAASGVTASRGVPAVPSAAPRAVGPRDHLPHASYAHTDRVTRHGWF